MGIKLDHSHEVVDEGTQTTFRGAIMRDQVGQHGLFRGKTVRTFAPVECVNEGFLTLYEDSAGSLAGERKVDHVIGPAEIGIGAQAVVHQVPVSQQPGGEIRLFTAGPGDRTGQPCSGLGHTDVSSRDDNKDILNTKFTKEEKTLIFNYSPLCPWCRVSLF